MWLFLNIYCPFPTSCVGLNLTISGIKLWLLGLFLNDVQPSRMCKGSERSHVTHLCWVWGFLFLFFTMFIKQVSLSLLGEGRRFGRWPASCQCPLKGFGLYTVHLPSCVLGLKTLWNVREQENLATGACEHSLLNVNVKDWGETWEWSRRSLLSSFQP